MDKKLYDLMNWERIEAIVYSECDHPEEILGAHPVRTQMLIQAFLPGAKEVSLRIKKDGTTYPMQEADEAGFFALLLPQKKISPYEFVAQFEDGTKREIQDPYLYADSPFIEEKTLKHFAAGTAYDIYEVLGAFPVCVSGTGKEAVITRGKRKEKKTAKTVDGTFFAVWAPNAMRVSVVGDFNDWDGRWHQMCRLGDSGIFTLFIPQVFVGDIYKYEIKQNARTVVCKTDPYGFFAQLRPENASVVTDLSGFSWKDKDWLDLRKKQEIKSAPFLAYELHLGSWKKKENGEFFTYREIAKSLIDYVQTMGYTHVEFMPLTEHAKDESLGFLPTGYFAVTSRYGTPQDFMYLVNALHAHNIGVILDWVPSYFSKDESALARFDGTCLYEHLDPRRGENARTGTLKFNYGRPQVKNFLIASAMFWKKVYHVDGLRLDAVSSMLYLDYDKGEGEWLPNEYGGNEDLDAVCFLQTLSQVFHAGKDGALLIAEESAAWPKVTESPADNGLGFDFKWNTSWINDFLSYMQTDPLFRKGRHGQLIDSMDYAYSENFILPFLADGKAHKLGTMLLKMPGDQEQKFGNLRVAFGFLMTHPGKKLQIMDEEFKQREEWSVPIEPGQDLYWEKTEEIPYRGLQIFVRDLNRFYIKHAALYECDYDTEGFMWLSCLDADHSIITFFRQASKDKERLVVICNFTPVMYENFKVGVPFAGTYREIFNGDAEIYGGTGCKNKRAMRSRPVSWDGRENSITLNVPPFGFCILEGKVPASNT